MTRAPILAAFVAVALGIGMADALGLAPAPALGLCVALGALLGVAWLRGSGVGLASLGLLLGLGALSAALEPVPDPLAVTCALDADAGRWRGRVDAPVERIPELGSASEVRQRTVLTELWEKCGSSWQPRHGRVSVGLWGGPALGRGDQVETSLRLEPLDAARNPVGLDPVAYARRNRLSARGSAASPFVVLERGAGLVHGLDELRAAASIGIEAALPPREATLAKALSLGDDAAVAPEDQQTWADAGIAHLLAVSGLQVGLLALAQLGALTWLLRRSAWLTARVPARRVAAWAAIPGVVLYTLLVGVPAPAVRAAVMSVAYLVGLGLGRPSRALNGLGLAGVLLVVVDPTALYDVSFLLSFVGVAALIIMPPLPGPSPGSPSPTLGSRARRWLLGALATTTAATLLTGPVTARYFGSVSLVAPLANLPAVPLASLVATPVAMALALVAPVSATLAHGLAVILGPLLAGLDALAAFFAAWPGARTPVRPLGPIELLLYYGVVGALALTLRRRRRWPWLAAAALGLTVALALHAGLGHRDRELRILHPYVGQGDAAVLLLPDGGTIVFDAGGAVGEGGFDPGRLVLAPLLSSLGVRRIDLAVLSHPHPDHLNGFTWLAKRFPIDELWWPGTGEEVRALRDLLETVRAQGGRTTLASTLPDEVVREGVRLLVKHPRPTAAEAEGLAYDPALADNDNSVVLEVAYGERRFLFPGDVEHEAEATIAPRLEPVDVMKAPHHGSRTSSSPALLDAAQPKLVVISCGAGNRFGFPHPDVVARYAERGLRVLRTDRDGLIELDTDGRALTIRCQRGCRDE